MYNTSTGADVVEAVLPSMQQHITWLMFDGPCDHCVPLSANMVQTWCYITNVHMAVVTLLVTQSYCHNAISSCDIGRNCTAPECEAWSV